MATFHNNMTSTFNVLHAAVRVGISTVVYASSETVLGLPFDTPPPYLPVDEEYPARPESVYSLVKHLEEQMAIELCRWHPELSITALRFSNVMDVEDYAEFPAFDGDPRLRKWNLWGYIDGRDGALAVELALARRGGFDRFVIASPDTVMTRTTPRPGRRGRSRGCPSGATSATTRRCSRSGRPAASSASSRSTPGATTSDVTSNRSDVTCCKT